MVQNLKSDNNTKDESCRIGVKRRLKTDEQKKHENINSIFQSLAQNVQDFGIK